MALSICCAQLNVVVGGIPGNVEKIMSAAQQAYDRGARLLLTSELALCGYAAEDLYLRPAFIDACEQAMQQLADASNRWPGMSLLVGHPRRGSQYGQGGPGGQVLVQELFNTATVLSGGRQRQH